MADPIHSLAANVRKAGIEIAFGVTGSGPTFRLIQELEALGIPFFPVAHEAAGALMAGACSRSGKVKALALSIKGPGFVNMLPGMLSNRYEGRSALTISEAFSPSMPRHRQHKRLDQRAAGMSFVKAYGLLDADASILDSLLTSAQSEYPGPVHCDLISDPSTSPSPAIPSGEPKPPVPSHPVKSILESIQASQRPLLALGSLATRLRPDFDWGSLGIPVITTAAAKGAADERGSWSAGVFTGETGELSPEKTLIPQADLVIGIGVRNLEVVQARKFPSPCLLLDVIGEGVQEGFQADGIRVSDTLDTELDPILEALRNRTWGQDKIREIALRRYALCDQPNLPPAAFEALNRCLDPRAILVLDTGLFCTLGEMLWKASDPGRFCGSSCGRFMGTSLPTALGLALRDPTQPVVCVAGDGGIRPYWAELRLAIEQKLKLLVLFLSDGRYGSIAKGFDHQPSRHAWDIPGSSWWKAADAMGCPAMTVADARELESAVKRWQSGSHPLFLEMRFDPSPYANLASLLR